MHTDMAGTFGIPHRRFLQGMMSRGICSAAEVKELFAASFLEKPQNFDNHIVPFLRLLNSRIRPYNMELRKGIDERTGSHYYCLTNCQESEISLLASNYTPVELDYFRTLLSAIVRSANGYITSIAALNLARALKKPISTTEVELLLKRFVESQWISEFRGNVNLGTRCIVEMGGYIRETFPDDCRTCGLCKQLILMGDHCKECETSCHLHCVRRVSLNRCPRCSSVWPSVGSDVGSRTSSAAANVEDDTGDDGDGDVPKSIKQSQARKKRKH